MGEAADDLWDRCMQQEHDFSMMLKNIREHCNDPMRSCHIVHNDDEDDDIGWMPYRCSVCGSVFDYP